MRGRQERQRAVIEFYPSSVASVAFRQLAQEIDSWPLPTMARGHLEFFAERLLLSRAADPLPSAEPIGTGVMNAAQSNNTRGEAAAG